MPNLYQDRKMLKWLPFQSLPEQGDALLELYNTPKNLRKPVLSEDQLAELQYQFEEAFYQKKEVTFIIFQARALKEKKGIIIGYEASTKILYLTTGTLYISDILKIKE